MSKSKKTSERNADSEATPTFEQSLAELQQIVDDLEDGSLGIEKSMQRFEEGILLLRNCYEILEQAEQKIEILTGIDAEGNPVTKKFEATATLERSEQTAGRRRAKKAVDESRRTDKTDEQNTAGTLF